MFIEVKNNNLMSWADYRFSQTAIEVGADFSQHFANGYAVVEGKVIVPAAETDYRQKREAEFPALGNMIDALCKAEQGDRSELERLNTLREAVKQKYPKA